jgi:dienelactone hydrolase
VNSARRLGHSLKGEVQGYLAVPATGQGCGILWLHEEGLSPERVQESCEQWARAGFVVLAPTLSAEELSLDAAPDQIEKSYAQVVNRLLSESAVNGAQINCLAFSDAAPMALFGSLRNPRVGGLALLHPQISSDAMNGLKKEPVMASPSSKRFMGFFSGKVESVSTQVLVEKHFAPSNIIQLEAVREGFMDEGRPDRFDATVSRECRQRIAEFFSAVIA